MNKSKDALSAVLKDLKRVMGDGSPPASVAEYQARGGVHKEWEIRKFGGLAALLRHVGAQPEKGSAAELAVQIKRLKQDNERLKKLQSETEALALSSAKMSELIMDTKDLPIANDHDWMKGAAKTKNTTGIGVLLLSDIHFDEVVNPRQIGDCNEYNREIATKRLHNTFRNAVSLLKGHMSSAKYEGIVCNLGGDLLSGNIHEELVESNEACINQSIIALTEILVEGIGGLADEFGKVFVPCVTGNHGRMHKKPRAKNRAFENFEWLIYQYLMREFKGDSRVTFDIPEGSDTHYNVFKSRYLLTHGDQFRGGDGIGGIMVPIMRGASKKQMRQQAIGVPFDVILMGHWHQYIHMNRLVINGSVKGYDEYAWMCNFPFEPAQQALWIAHKEYGMTYRMPILCDKS